MHDRVRQLIDSLELAPHPEGGHFREIHRSEFEVDPMDARERRAALTVIYFLLGRGEISRWHRVLSDEAWSFIEGDELELHVMTEDFGQQQTLVLGPAGERAQPVRVVARGKWQAATTLGDYTLVSCSVGPGFDFADFKMLRDVPGQADLLGARQEELRKFL